MPKADKEFILNYAMNRWQLNFKRNVGATSDSIRLCRPQTVDDWEQYYYDRVFPYEHLVALGEKLYQHIQNDLPREERFHPALLSSITEKDCIDYMRLVVIVRTFNGYKKEIGEC